MSQAPRKHRARGPAESRGTSHARGYGAAWQLLRKAFLREHPCCDLCRRPATDVHHKLAKRKGGTDHDHNLQSLCHRCHSRLTQQGE